MKIKLLSNIVIDTEDIPKNFDDMIRGSFEAYTLGTNPDYMYQDKLKYIDDIVKKLHKVNDSYEKVKSLIIEFFEGEVDELGIIPDKEDLLSIEFMEHCYDKGRADGCLRSYDFCNNEHENEKIMQILCRIIKVVMNYEGGVEMPQKHGRLIDADAFIYKRFSRRL